ncbi:hypothetical protein [Halococcus thailandensis]|uniref:Uncharacterized protein n=1 Tax=Halococcus thailandensis JCM 13552 TaxID=1227457 RepID=M0NFV7_9EURY|nr:hypothetical protein [Halococcus thailandensis]EMA56736.1 hypothetical protein C451_00775 [Halococcus thailandensis JCM 13552]
MTSTNTKAASDADELIEQLLGDDRDVLTDAVGVRAVDDLQGIEVIHRAINGEQVIIHYNHYTAYQSDGNGSMDEIDIFATKATEATEATDQ